MACCSMFLIKCGFTLEIKIVRIKEAIKYLPVWCLKAIYRANELDAAHKTWLETDPNGNKQIEI